MNDLTIYEIEDLDNLNTKTQDMEFGSKFQEVIDAINDNMTAGTPVNAVAAAMALAVTGVAIHGESVSIDNPAVLDEDIYEFSADAAQSVSDPAYIPVDITAHVTGSLGTLTMDVQPLSGDTFTIGSKEFTFVPVGTATADGEVSVGANIGEAQVNLVASVNGTDGISDAHTLVSAGDFAGDDCVITALIGGVAGDAIATTETFDEVTNVFAAGTLGSGADCIAANAITELAAAFVAYDTQSITAVDGAGDTLDVTSEVAGVIGNAVIIAEDMANGAFTAGAVLLAGGIDGTVGYLDDAMVDSSYLYRCVADNTIADDNWRRISLGSAY